MCNYIVFSPKYRGRVLVGDRALVAGAIIRRICEEMDIEVIDMAVNPDHVALFIKCPPKYSVSYLSKMIKRRSSRELKKEFPHLKEWYGDYLWALSCYHGFVGNGEMLSRSIFQHIIRMNIIDNNSKITTYRPGTFVRGKR